MAGSSVQHSALHSTRTCSCMFYSHRTPAVPVIMRLHSCTPVPVIMRLHSLYSCSTSHHEATQPVLLQYQSSLEYTACTPAVPVIMRLHCPYSSPAVPVIMRLHTQPVFLQYPVPCIPPVLVPVCSVRSVLLQYQSS